MVCQNDCPDKMHFAVDLPDLLLLTGAICHIFILLQREYLVADIYIVSVRPRSVCHGFFYKGIDNRDKGILIKRIHQ